VERDGAAKDAGIAAGHAAAAATIRAGGLDPAASLTPYTPAGRPGQWLPTAFTSIDVHYPAMKPWFMASASAFRPGPPVALDSARWLKDVDEVRRIGGKASTERRAADTVLARFWVQADPTSAFRTVAELRHDLNAIRLRGYAIDDEQNTIGVTCFAVAMTGVPQPTAVSTTLLTQRVRPENQSRLVGDLQTLARELATYAIG